MGAYAQSYPNSLSTDTVNPIADSRYIKEVRAKMDSIRRHCHRPTVAVVLSGGGAKGAAEVGALKYIEEQHIPVDFVCGTSIGGMIGGLYALGYKSSDIHELFTTQDWGITLTDRIDNKYYSFKQKQYKTKYLLSIPFKYEDEDFLARVREQERYEESGEDHSNSARRNDLNTKKGVNTLSSSLPSGYVYGFNVNNLLSSLTVGYQDSLSFADLPIPYACVASDMVSCKAKNWGSGVLKEAMRSTMSIPGLFDPVRSHGMVLVDGGTRNNFPTDIAKAVGADYIVGIELSDLSPSYSELNNIADVLMQFIKMLGKDSFDKNIDEADVVVKPYLKGFNMLSFNAEAVDTMVARGYRAARQQADLIAEIKSIVPDAETVLNAPKAVDIRHRKVQIKSVSFNGVTDEESLILQKMISMSVGSFVDARDLDKAMSIVQATGTFENVVYSLLGREEPYDLVFNCQKGPVHQFGLGLRLDTEEWVSVALNLGLNAHKLMGSKLDFNAKIGQNQNADLKYSCGTPGHPSFNVEAFVGHYYGQLHQYNDQALSDDPIFEERESFTPNQTVARLRNDASYWTHKEMIYIQQMMWRRLNIQLGVKNQYYALSPNQYYGNTLMDEYGPEIMKGNYLGAFANFEIFSLNDKFFPSKGIDFKLTCNYDPFKKGVSSYQAISSAGLDFKFVLPFGSRVAFIPDFHVRAKYNPNPDIEVGHPENFAAYSMSHLTFLGGFVPDRYIEGQVPYFGINHCFYTGDQLAEANFDLRVRASNNLYMSLKAAGFYSVDYLKDILDYKNAAYDCAFGLEAGYDSIIGPIRANVHWDMSVGFGAFVSVGYDF